MPGLTQPLLINILGHAAGALIFAIFLFLLYSGRGWSGLRGRYLSGLAAGLSLVWNLGSLVVLAWPGLPPRALNLVVAISFSVLSLLPAVLLHVSLEDSRPVLVGAGYLRGIPRDPFTGATTTWQEISDPVEKGVVDIFSGAEFVGTNGTPYNSW